MLEAQQKLLVTMTVDNVLADQMLWEIDVIFDCSSSDTRRLVSCSLPDCLKKLGNWSNDGDCIGLEGKDCGPGNQLQTRTCVDGTNIKCDPTEMARTQKCNLPHCEKILGNWTNVVSQKGAAGGS